VQDQADVHLLVLSPDYLASLACIHEMDRAIALDPTFATGRILPVMRVPCSMPAPVQAHSPIYVRLHDDSAVDQWDLVMNGCLATLGTKVPHWLDCLGQASTLLRRGESVHLRVFGSPKWRELLTAICGNFPGQIGRVDLNSGDAVTRRSLISAVLSACGHKSPIGPNSDDLAELQARIGNSSGAMLELRHFDRVKDPDRQYGDAFFWALNHLIEKRRLTVLVESRESLGALVPTALLESGFVSLTKTVELRAN